METATGIMSCAVNVNFGAVFEGIFFLLLLDIIKQGYIRDFFLGG